MSSPLTWLWITSVWALWALTIRPSASLKSASAWSRLPAAMAARASSILSRPSPAFMMTSMAMTLMSRFSSFMVISPYRRYGFVPGDFESGLCSLCGLGSLGRFPLLLLLELGVVGCLEEGIPDQGRDHEVDADQDDVAEVAARHEEGGHCVGGKVHIEVDIVDGAPAKLEPEVGEGGQDDGDQNGGDEHEGVADDGAIRQGLVDVKDGGDKGGFAQQAILLGLCAEHEECQGKGGALTADVVVAAEPVGVDVLGLHTGGHQRGVLCDGGLGDGAGHRGEDPAGDAEEVEDVLEENDQHDAGCALGKAGDRLHDQLDHGKDVDLENEGQQIAHKEADEDGDDVVKPVLDEVGDDAVLTEEGVFRHQLVHDGHQKADEHGGEHTAGAKLAQIHERTAVHRLEVHAHHIGADAGEACDQGTVLLFDLVQAVVGDDEDDEQADQAEGVGADGADVRQRRDKVADDGPDGGDSADHREGHDVQDGVGRDAKPEVGCDFVYDRDQDPLDPCLYLFHFDPPARLTGLLQVTRCKIRWRFPEWPRRPEPHSRPGRWR